jgi:hypothetical protein
MNLFNNCCYYCRASTLNIHCNQSFKERLCSMTEVVNDNKKPNWFKRHKIWTAVIAVFVLISIIGAATGDDTKEAPAKSTTSSSVTEGESQPTIAGTLEDKSAQAATPTPPSAPKVYEGSGDDIVTIQKPTTDGSTAILKFECPACSSNVTVKTNGAESLLVNEIGAYSGFHLIDTRAGSNTTEATVHATGAWKMTVGGLDMATQQVAGQPVSGTGDAVVHIVGSTRKAAITNVGESNFTVKVLPENGGSDLAVNTIGSYKGTVALSAPAYVQVGSSGNWTITPQ